MNKTGGWMYECNDGCGRIQNILVDTIWENKGWGLDKHVTLIFRHGKNNRIKKKWLHIYKIAASLWYH